MAGQSGQDNPPPLPGNLRRAETSELKQSLATPPSKAGWLRRWFWAPVKIGENWAQTLLRVLGNLFRTAVTLTIVLNGIGFSILYVSYQIERRNEAEREAIRNFEEAAQPINFVSVSLDQKFLDGENAGFADGCNKDYPFATMIYNGSKMAMTETWLVFSVRKKGTSEVLRFRGRNLNGGYSDRWIDSEENYKDVIRRIILPNSSNGWCWGFPPESFLNFDASSDYVYKVEIGSSTVFAEPEDWMYEELGVSK
jgi:hypothetical protein